MRRAEVFIVNKTDKQIAVGRIVIKAGGSAVVPEKEALRKASYIDRMVREGKLAYSFEKPDAIGEETEAPDIAQSGTGSASGEASASSDGSAAGESSEEDTQDKTEDNELEATAEVQEEGSEQSESASDNSNGADGSEANKEAEEKNDNAGQKESSDASEAEEKVVKAPRARGKRK